MRSKLYLGNVKSNLDAFMTQSHCTALPVCALIRDMIPVKVLSATCLPPMARTFSGCVPDVPRQDQ